MDGTLSTYASVTKLMWILENVPGVQGRVERGNSLFGNPDTRVIWDLTSGVNGGTRIIDVINASRTMLMNLYTLK